MVWLGAQLLDLMHGLAIWTVLFGFTAVLAVACQYDPTLLDERQDAVDLAQHWRGGLQAAIVGTAVALLTGVVLWVVCRWARPNVAPPAPTSPASVSSFGQAVRLTRAELRSQSRRTSRRNAAVVVVASIVAGLPAMASVDDPVWETQIDMPSRVWRLVFTPIAGALLLLCAVGIVVVVFASYALIRIASAMTRQAALAGIVVVNDPPPSPAESPSPGDEPDRPRIDWPDPALLAYLCPNVPGKASRKGPDVRIGCSTATVDARTLTGWMVSMSVWALVDAGLMEIALIRHGVLRRRRIVVTRTRAGMAAGTIAEYVTSLPTDDPSAYVDDDTLDRQGPVGDLVELFNMWQVMWSDDPDWKLAAAVFDRAAATGVCTGDVDHGYIFDCVRVADLRVAAARLQHDFERAMRERPLLMTTLLRDGQKCVGTMARSEAQGGDSLRAATDRPDRVVRTPSQGGHSPVAINRVLPIVRFGSPPHTIEATQDGASSA